jgi:phosphate transport system substrate-binding protein
MTDQDSLQFDEAPPPAQRKRDLLPNLGILGWLIAIMLVVVLVAGGVVGWMAYNFTGDANQRAVTESGAIPVTRDFAPGGERAADVLFRIGGDSALAGGVLPDMVAAWMRTNDYSSVGISRSGTIAEVRGNKGGRTWRVPIASGSTTGGFQAMLERRVEMVAADRSILPEEADQLSAMGDMSSLASERVIALDAELVIVNRGNPLSGIGTETLGQILAGEITDWSEVVDKGEGPIKVFLVKGAGNLPSGFARSLLGDREVPEGVELLEDSDAVSAAVARTAGSIGLVLWSSGAGSAKVVGVNERNASLFTATRETIANESYPLAVRVALYLGSVAPDPALKSFADFAQSSNGQMVVARSNYVDQNIAMAKFEPSIEAPRSYANFARSGQRMSFDVRFHLGANELDSKAQRDLAAFAAFAKEQGIDNRRIALLGFADNVGARATNVGLAKSRAERVAAQLETLGIVPGVIQSFGEAMPVGANSTESGRIRNRRVEVWICDGSACPLVDLAAALGPARPALGGGIPAGVRLGPPTPTPKGEEPPKG